MKKVKEVMTKDVRCCEPNTNLAKVAAIMWESDCGALPVIDESGEVLGMITDRDVCIAVATKQRLASDIAVREAMSSELYDCKGDDDISTALEIMRKVKVRRLPVVNADGLLEGLLSLSDLALQACDNVDKRTDLISYKDVALTLKAVSTHGEVMIVEDEPGIELGISSAGD
jgi:CBS domain-containing protein